MSNNRRPLPEIAMSHVDAETLPAPFPEVCPRCGAAKTNELNGTNIADYRRTITYACGASYTHKPQIQNHTEKWWGTCTAEAQLEAVERLIADTRERYGLASDAEAMQRIAYELSPEGADARVVAALTQHGYRQAADGTWHAEGSGDA